MEERLDIMESLHEVSGLETEGTGCLKKVCRGWVRLQDLQILVGYQNVAHGKRESAQSRAGSGS